MSGFNDPLDAVTSADESLAGVNRRLDDIGGLLETQLAQKGVTDLDSSRYNPTPFEYATIPSDGGDLALPPGRTHFDFDKGKIVNEKVGEIGDIRDFDDMSEGIDSQIQSLRSLFLYSDVVAKVRLDDGDWFKLDSCQYVPMKSQGFTSFDIKAKIPFNLYGAASTRSQVFADTDSISVHMTRKGTFSGTADSWTSLGWTTHHGFEERGMAYAKGALHTVSFARNTIRVENTGSNDLYVRVRGADTHSKDWYEIGRREASDGTLKALTPGDHHVFHVEQAHHLLNVQIKDTSGSATNTLKTRHSMTGGAP